MAHKSPLQIQLASTAACNHGPMLDSVFSPAPADDPSLPLLPFQPVGLTSCSTRPVAYYGWFSPIGVTATPPALRLEYNAEASCV